MPALNKLVLALGLSILLRPGGADAASMPAQTLRDCMATLARVTDFQGVVYARHDHHVVQESFGAADAQGRVPITAATRFNIGSAGKMFTAVAIGRLVDRHRVELDAPIRRYLPGLKPELASITIAQLLNHTAGLGDYLDPSHRQAIEAANTASELLPLALATPPAFKPGTKRAYSNSGYVVLGAIIEKVSGLTYAQFLQREIFTPLGMSHTRLDASGSAEPMTRMSPAGRLDRPVPSPLQLKRASPAGGAFSTAADMSLFLSALSQGRLLSRQTMQTFLAPRQAPGGSPATYGYGFTLREKPVLRIGHGGGAPGVNAQIALYPDAGWQLIALSNEDPPAASRMVDLLENAVMTPGAESACGMSPGTSQPPPASRSTP